jgi:hypothetical protein
MRAFFKGFKAQDMTTALSLAWLGDLKPLNTFESFIRKAKTSSYPSINTNYNITSSCEDVVI